VACDVCLSGAARIEKGAETMKPLWLIGGLGLGAGLMYLLDPEKGEQRREYAQAQLESYGRQLGSYGRQAEHLLDDTRRTLGRQTQALWDRPRDAYRKMSRYESGLADRLREQTEQLGTPSGMFLLACLGLGAGLLYMLESGGGDRRRALLRNTARTYWHKAGNGHRGVASNVHADVR
jgi:hypothetical protein